MHVYMGVGVGSVHMCMPAEARGIRFPRAGARGGYEVLVGPGNQTWVLHKSTMHS